MANTAPVLEFVPVGFRFCPTEEELVGHYLTNKLLGEDFDLQIIPEIDICKHEPWDLPAFSMINSDDPEWFFFSPRCYKYSNSTRSNRATSRGFWKPTGTDRDIKVRGSNEIIGTKKTLVFHRGRVPNGVKTNWIVHEYQAVTFPADLRTFVLCKLMMKPEKAEGRTDTLSFVGGELSGYMSSDREIRASGGRIPDVHSLPQVNATYNFQTQHSADEAGFNMLRSSPIVNEQNPFSILFNSQRERQSPIVNEQNPFSMLFSSQRERPSPIVNEQNPFSMLLNSQRERPSPVINEQNPFSMLLNSQRERPSPVINEQSPISIIFNSDAGNGDCSVNVPPEATEEEDNADKFVDSIFVDDEEDLFLSQGTIASIHARIPTESLRKVYCESSDTDAEVVSAQYGYIPDTSTRSNRNDVPREIMLMNSSELSSNQQARQERKGRPFQDDLDSSSGDSTPARPFKINRLKINRLQHGISASTPKTWKTQYQPRSANSVSLRAGVRRSQTHRKISTKEAYHEAQKETPDHSSNYKREARVTDKRNTSKSSSSESSGVNGGSSFIQLETLPSSENLSQRSVYLGNVVIGLILFVVIIWEMLSYGKLC